ncbi:MAG: hypothetical protein ACI93R_002924 [Flavobacteriales bacterium]|jgi:hypothetical protein
MFKTNVDPNSIWRYFILVSSKVVVVDDVSTFGQEKLGSYLGKVFAQRLDPNTILLSEDGGVGGIGEVVLQYKFEEKNGNTRNVKMSVVSGQFVGLALLLGALVSILISAMLYFGLYPMSVQIPSLAFNFSLLIAIPLTVLSVARFMNILFFVVKVKELIRGVRID